jgi:hypothetical protein
MLMTNADAKPGQELTWDQRLLRNSGRNKNALRDAALGAAQSGH